MQAALALAELDEKLVGSPIPNDRIFDCVNVILSFQNADGGWSTYENTRSYPALEVSHCQALLFMCCPSLWQGTDVKQAHSFLVLVTLQML